MLLIEDTTAGSIGSRLEVLRGVHTSQSSGVAAKQPTAAGLGAKEIVGLGPKDASVQGGGEGRRIG